MRLARLALVAGIAAACSAPKTKEFVSTQQKVRFVVPAAWASPIEEGPSRGLAGPDGYVRVTAMAGSPTVQEACRVDAFHRMKPYGADPKVTWIKVDGQPGCRIIPSEPNAQTRRIPAGLILEHRKPVIIEPRRVHPRPYPYLVIWTDPAHLAMIEQSLRFDR